MNHLKTVSKTKLPAGQMPAMALTPLRKEKMFPTPV